VDFNFRAGRVEIGRGEMKDKISPPKRGLQAEGKLGDRSSKGVLMWSKIISHSDRG